MPKSTSKTRQVFDKYRLDYCPACGSNKIHRRWYIGRTGPKDYTYQCLECKWDSEKEN